MEFNPGDIDGIVVGVRAAYKGRRFGVSNDGLKRLSQTPENEGLAMAVHATLLAESSPDGPVEAVKAIQGADVDLTDPANAMALRVLLVNLAVIEEHEKAALQIGSALGAHPEAAVFHELNGGVLIAAGESPEKAREAFDRALELEAEHAKALTGLAALTAQAGDVDAALALYDRATDLDPKDTDSAIAAATLVAEAGRPADAQKRFEAVLADYPREADASLALARILAEQRKFKPSLDYAKRAEWLKSPDAEETLAWIEGLRAKGE
jgi:tetratricopeptide (TPR) repeat protein